MVKPWNAERRIQGTPTSASTRKGASGGLAGRWLAAGEARPAHLYSSDLLRARLTAEPLAAALGLPIRYVPALRERRYGIFEGLTYDEARARFPDDYAAFEHREPDYAFPHGGESLRTFFARVTGALEALHAAHPGETVAIVTHGGVLDIVNRFVRGQSAGAALAISISRIPDSIGAGGAGRLADRILGGYAPSRPWRARRTWRHLIQPHRIDAVQHGTIRPFFNGLRGARCFPRKTP